MSCQICDESVTASARGDKATSSTEIINRFVQQLGVKGQELNVILCEACNSGVVKATMWREEVGEVERDVRSLQRIILKMMRQLNSLQGNYLGEMRRLEGKMREIEKGTARGERRRKEGSPCIADKADAIRQGILDVVADLSAFQDGLDSQNEGSHPSNSEVADLTQHHNPTSTVPMLLQQQPIPVESVFKEEVECSGQTTSPPEGQEEEPSPDQDHLLPEDDNPIDIEHVVYSEDLNKREPLPVEVSDDESNSSVPVSTSSVSRFTSVRKNATLRRFACQFCGKKFMRSADLKHHIYTHTGERPYKCHLCPRAFTQRHHLTDHLVSHGGKKPFTCSQCEQGFTRRGNLEKHKKRKICKIFTDA